jgi:A/G-specific adenine glycosylase
MNVAPLIKWSQKEFPLLPWRINRSLYRTLVSEIMLQQTTVGTVKNHFDRFLVVFPTLKSLAAASEEELLVAWKGLGYYRRARNLKKIAEALQDEHQGEFPHDAEQLMKIPGIGPYTASALIAIGMDRPALAVDANLERVIARLYGLQDEKGPKLQKHIQKLFSEKKIFDGKFSYRGLNEALMDLGRTLCQARKASCELCLLRADCKAYQEGEPLKYPLEKVSLEKKKEDHELQLLRVFVLKKDKLLVYKKESNEWLSGQYEVPTLIMSTTDEKIQQYPKLKSKVKSEKLKCYKTGITKYGIENFIIEASEEDLKKFGFTRPVEWRSVDSDQSNLTTATLKGLKHLN